jgi:hypothetical protein
MTRKVKYSRNRGIWPIFPVCPRFIQLQINATSQLKTSIETTLEIFHTNFEHLTDLAKLINGLFLKPDSWPTSQIYYYYGIIPKIDLETHNLPHLSHTQLQRMHQHISNDFHSTAIKLAGRILGYHSSNIFSFPIFLKNPHHSHSTVSPIPHNYIFHSPFHQT